MLKPPRLGGADQLRLFVDFLGFDHACSVIDVHPSTMRRWLRGSVPVPQAPLQALYWLTPWGASAAFSESHYTHQELCWRLRVLESERSPGKADMGAHLAANAPVWNPLRPRRLRLVPAAVAIAGGGVLPNEGLQGREPAQDERGEQRTAHDDDGLAADLG